VSAPGESRDSVTEFVDGDPRAAALLRGSPADLRRRLEEEPGTAGLRDTISQVLDGRLGVRGRVDVPELHALADQGTTEVQQAWHALGPEERARLVDEGRAADDASRGGGEQRRQ